MNQSIMGKALLKGTLMALTNACIIWLFAYIAGFDRSVWMVVIIIAGAALAYVTAFLEARAMQSAARGGDVSTRRLLSILRILLALRTKKRKKTTSWTRAPTRTRATSTPEAPAARVALTTVATAAPTTLAAAIPVEATPAVAATKL